MWGPSVRHHCLSLSLREYYVDNYVEYYVDDYVKGYVDDYVEYYVK